MNVSKIFVLAALALASTPGLSDDSIFGPITAEMGEPSDPHFTVGAGANFNSKYAPRALVGIRFNGLHEDGPPGEAWRLFWVEMQVAARQTGQGSWEMPALKVDGTVFTKFYPFQEVQNGFSGLEWRFVPFTVQRDIELGNTGASVRVMGVRISGMDPTPEDAWPNFVELVADAVGYNYVHNAAKQYLEDPDDDGDIDSKNPHGFYFLRTDMKFGWDFGSKQGDGLRLRVVPVNIHFEVSSNKAAFDLYSQLALVFRTKYTETSAFIKAGFGDDTSILVKSYDEAQSSKYITTGVNVQW